MYPKFKISKFRPNFAKHERTPIGSNLKIPIYGSQGGVVQDFWRGVIGSLLFLAPSRSDVYKKKRVCARYQESLKVSYLLAIEGEYMIATKPDLPWETEKPAFRTNISQPVFDLPSLKPATTAAYEKSVSK